MSEGDAPAACCRLVEHKLAAGGHLYATAATAGTPSTATVPCLRRSQTGAHRTGGAVQFNSRFRYVREKS